MQGHTFTDDLEDILNRKPDVWESLRGKSLFISGGTGWFGRWLLEAIAYANAKRNTDIRVLVLSRNPAVFAQAAPHLANNPAIRFHTGDVCTFDYPKERFTHFIHAATTSAHETFHREAPLAKFDTLVTGTRRVLDFAASVHAEHFLFTSSGVAYGSAQSGLPLREDDDHAPNTLDPMTALGQAKRAAEFLCATYAQQYGWHLSIGRCFSFVGPFMPLDIHYAIGNFIQCAMKGEPIIIHGDGSPVRSYLYTADLVVWLLMLLQCKGKPAVFNVGSDVAITIAELAHLIRDLLHPQGEVQVLGRKDVHVGNPVRGFYVPDVGRARRLLGLDVWTSLGEAVRYAMDAFGKPVRRNS